MLHRLGGLAQNKALLRIGKIKSTPCEVLGDRFVVGPRVGGEEGKLEAAATGRSAMTFGRRAAMPREIGRDV